eukprot:snap_masked-scaffold_2-processed-gene-13.26-mRNA-1 protein AED:0.20 eAED:0.20 QI:0/-1/0/1/-1/1/1/0/251
MKPNSVDQATHYFPFDEESFNGEGQAATRIGEASEAGYSGDSVAVTNAARRMFEDLHTTIGTIQLPLPAGLEDERNFLQRSEKIFQVKEKETKFSFYKVTVLFLLTATVALLSFFVVTSFRTSEAHVETLAPSPSPTLFPSVSPSLEPTSTPTFSPSLRPSLHPTASPTGKPTASPTEIPTNTPTQSPSKIPTRFPTVFPTFFPTAFPTLDPTPFPTLTPVPVPTPFPTPFPTPLCGNCVEPRSRSNSTST